MLITIPQELTVTETFNLGSFGEVVLALGRLQNPTHIVSPGATALAVQDLNDRSRIILDDGSNLARANFDPPPRLYPEGGLRADNTLRVGDSASSDAGNASLTGVLDQRFNTYRLQPVEAITFRDANDQAANPRPPTPTLVGGTLRVASFNVLNYFTTLDTGAPLCGPNGGLDCRGANSAEEFTRQRDKILSAIAILQGHIVGVIELENNPMASLQDIVDGLNARQGPGTYAFINTGTIGTDAIKVAFLYQPAMVTPVGPFKILNNAVDPRAIDTQNRPALAQTFQHNATREKVTVVVNHWKSKGSSCDTPAAPGEVVDPDLGDGQGNCNLTRLSMAEALVDWLATNPTGSRDTGVLIIGDLNAYAMEDPVQALLRAGYYNMVRFFLHDDAYSFVFQGQSGYLDHALVSSRLRPLVTGVSEWHINADEPVALDYNTEWTASIAKNATQLATLYKADPFRSSDHDPVLIGLNLLCGDLNDDNRVTDVDYRLFLAALAALPLGFLGAKNMLPLWLCHVGVRRGLDVLRGIDTLIWALVFVNVVGLGPFAGILALAVSDTGTLAKLYAEAIEHIDGQPVDGIRATGAPWLLVIRFGVLPQVLPVLCSHVLYYFESNTRSATILGMVGAGGIGVQLADRMRVNNWDEACWIMLLILVTVAVLDTVSRILRLRLVGVEKARRPLPA